MLVKPRDCLNICNFRKLHYCIEIIQQLLSIGLVILIVLISPFCGESHETLKSWSAPIQLWNVSPQGKANIIANPCGEALQVSLEHFNFGVLHDFRINKVALSHRISWKTFWTMDTILVLYDIIHFWQWINPRKNKVNIHFVSVSNFAFF